MKFKYKEFLLDVSIFDAAEEYWRQLFEEFIVEANEEQLWREWFPNVMGNGEKNRSGNPILTRLNEVEKRAVRVIQEDCEHYEDSHFSAWLDIFDEDVKELVISCVLSDETEELVREVLHAYIVEKASDEKIEAVIDRCFARTKKGKN